MRRWFWLLPVLAAIGCLWWLPVTTTADLARARQAPGAAFWLGTDSLGRSVAVQLWLGLRTSLLLSTVVVAINLVNGAWIGLLAADGPLAVPFSRLIDIGLAMPSLLVALLLVAMLGPGFGNLLLAFILLGWAGFARLVRGEVRRLTHEEYVLAARVVGVPLGRLARIHLLPQLAPLLLVQATFALGAVILGESTLSFLGLGDPSLPSLGKQLNDGIDYLRSAPHLTLFPGLLLALLVLAANLAGDRLQQRLPGGR